MYKFSTTSTERLATCNHELRLIMKEALSVSQMDFGIAEGYRSISRQNELYEMGLSQINGIGQKGKHNISPSLAVDIYAWVDGKASWSERDLCYLGGVITATAERLYQEGKVEHKLRWGGNWDMDGTIITDQNFMDLPHFELI